MKVDVVKSVDSNNASNTAEIENDLSQLPLIKLPPVETSKSDNQLNIVVDGEKLDFKESLIQLKELGYELELSSELFSESFTNHVSYYADYELKKGGLHTQGSFLKTSVDLQVGAEKLKFSSFELTTSKLGDGSIDIEVTDHYGENPTVIYKKSLSSKKGIQFNNFFDKRNNLLFGSDNPNQKTPASEFKDLVKKESEPLLKKGREIFSRIKFS